jgi:hypothetical protein
MEEQSILNNWLMSQKESRWTRSNIIMLFILVEHGIIGLKLAIGIIIPDIPKDVRDSEYRRKEQKEQA